MQNLKHIKDLIYKNRFRYAVGILFLVSVDVLQLILPGVLGQMTDLMKSGKADAQDPWRYALIIAAIAFGIAAFRFLWRYLIQGIARDIEMHLRNRFYAHLQRLDVNYYNNHKTGDLMAHATNDIGNVTGAAGQGIIFSIDSALILVVAIILMTRTGGWLLTLGSILPLASLGVGATFFVRQMGERIQKQQEAFSAMTETARENFSGIRVVKSFVQEMKEMDKFEKANLYSRQMNMRFARFMSMLFPTIMSVAALSFVVGLWYGGILVIRKSITLGAFVAFNSYLGMLIWPIAAFGWISSIFERGSVSLKRINQILEEEPQVREPENPADIRQIDGKIRFKDLTFTYPGSDKPALKNIDITIEKGKTLAIVGRTGSGKTTLINLIPRLFNVPGGTLFIDGTDINRIPLTLLRNSQGFVPQDSFLFSTTIRENIDFFLGRGEDEIIQAAKTAKIYENIMEFPNGFNTVVGERGVTLSGGQKQRIAIARAILRAPSILILDDCLSAVDAHTEKEILRELKQLMKERTSIIVSHRISAIMDADEIIVLQEGEIVERGTHQVLLEKQGAYYNLYTRQLLSESMEGEG